MIFRSERIESADRFVANVGAGLRHGEARAYYAPVSGHIQMPPFEVFRDAASYVAVSRMMCIGRRRTIASALISVDLGIVPEFELGPDHAAYLKSWLCVLAGDKRAIFLTAYHAQRAVNGSRASPQNGRRFDVPVPVSSGEGASPLQLRALALMAAHGELGPARDCAIFSGTGWEPKAVYEHAEWLVSPNVRPFPAYVVSAANIRDQILPPVT